MTTSPLFHPCREAGSIAAATEPLIDLGLLEFIRKRGGKVSPRQLARSLATCPTAADAKRRLASLVAAGMGHWTYPRPGPRGGRPTETFVLTAPPTLLGRLKRLHAEEKRMRGSMFLRELVRDLMLFLNRFPSVSCERLAEALTRTANCMTHLAKSDGSFPFPLFERRFNASARGAVAASWKCRRGL